MNTFSKYKTASEAYQKKIHELNETLIREIDALPDNPRINRISEKCFTISSSDLGTTNWTPFYHDFRNQYAYLKAVIENYPPDTVENIFQEIVTKGKHTPNKTMNYGEHIFLSRTIYYFHNDVRKLIKGTFV